MWMIGRVGNRQRVVAGVLLVLLYLMLIKTENTHTSFVIIGDWGAPEHDTLYQTTQVLVARAAGRVAEQLGDVQEVVSLGDSLYMWGMTSRDDQRLAASIQLMGSHGGLQGKDWLGVLGNHDCRGNTPDYLRAAAALREPALYIPEERYYSKHVTVGRSRFRMLFLDTCSLCCDAEASLHEVPALRELAAQYLKEARGSPRSENLAKQGRMYKVKDYARGFNGTLGRMTECSKLHQTSTPPRAAQLTWLEEQLVQSGSDWVMIFAHSPVFSVGNGHGSYPQLDPVHRLLSRLKPRRSVYISGDEHSMQVLEKDDVLYVVAGGGGGLDLHPLQPHRRPSAGVSVLFAEATHGFATFTVTSSALRVKLWAVSLPDRLLKRASPSDSREEFSDRIDEWDALSSLRLAHDVVLPT